MPAAGDFSATAAQTITLRAEEMWSNPMLFAGLDTKAATIRKQLEVQTARVRVLEDPDNDRDAKISWLDPCPVEDQACGDECDVTGTELFSDSKNYSMTMCREAAPKSINFDKLRTNTVTLDEQRALIIAKQAKALDE
ncbi:MAG TPA: hypothetical protein VD794_16040 [Flavisolibacter sp.]|nr:hypothetical protein [Flavisolibacter sp.]